MYPASSIFYFFLLSTALGDCSDLPKGYRSGIYKIQPTKSDEFDVYCEMVDYGGGWTVSW